MYVYYHFFQICIVSNNSVYEVVSSSCQKLIFSKALTWTLLCEFNELCSLVHTYPLTSQCDQLYWRASVSNSFSSHNVHEWLMFRGVIDISADIWWKLPIPLKVKVFMWLIGHNKILIKDNLLKRGWVGYNQCMLYDESESVAHLFFTCTFARQIWFWTGLSKLLSLLILF
jgi:zinc-binding in reverse transcriptase